MIAAQADKVRGFLRSVTVRSPLKLYEPRVPFQFESGAYIVKTAASIHELRQILKLRHAVFCREWRNQNTADGFDLDEFDLSSDHLMILEKTTLKVVGTYRIRCTRFHNKFYSQTEFQMAEFLKTEKTMIELGRACIDVNFRTGAVVQLLWRGISKYMNEVQADALFGCTSVIGLKKIHLPKLQSQLTVLNAINPDLPIRPLPHLHPSEHANEFCWKDEGQPIELPALLEVYLKAGAQLAAYPAVDLDFDCIDILTVLSRDTMSPLFRKRYGL